MRGNWRVWVGVAVSLLFLWLAFRNKDLATMGQALLAADYRYLAPAVLLYFAGVYIRTLRWQTLLSPIKALPVATLFPVVVIGFMANNILPARIGELVRAYVLSWRQGMTKSGTLATVAIERIFDGLTLVLFIVGAAVLVQLNAQVQGIAIVAAVLFVGLLAGLIVLSASTALQRFVLGILHRLLPDRLAGRLEQIVIGFVSGLASLRSRGDLIKIVATSVAAWLCEAGMYLIIGLAFDLGMTWPMALLTTAVANLFTLVPSSPGYVGIFEAGILAVLAGVMGLPEDVVLSYALVLHAALWLPPTVLGLVFWSRESLSWRDLRQVQAERRGAVHEPSLPASP